MTNIIQTFWSGGLNPIVNSYGWLRPEYHLVSWALSASLLSQHYNNLVLYTDSAGKHLLLDKLGLPFTDVHVELDCLNHWSENAWALAKVYTYSRQSEPFIHFDSDVFIWEPLRRRITNSDLISQNQEIGFDKKALAEFYSQLRYIPKGFCSKDHANESICMFNTGVFGGNNLAAIGGYCKEVFDIVQRNENVIARIDATTFSWFFEQMVFTQYAKNLNLKVEFVFPEIFENSHYVGFADFEEVPHNKKFLHLMNLFKRNIRALDLMERQLRDQFPLVYYRVLEICDEQGFLRGNKHLPTCKLFKYFLSGRPESKEAPLSNEKAENQTNIIFELENLDDTVLLDRDLQSHKLYPVLFGGTRQEILQKEIEASPFARVVGVTDRKISKDFDGISNLAGIAIVPEINRQVSEIPLDDLDVELFNCIRNPKSISQLLADLVTHFEEEDDGKPSIEFENLIFDRLKSFIYYRLVKLNNKK